MLPYNSSNKTIHLWAVGAIADYWMYATFALISPVFITGFGVSPILVGWALAFPRLFDALVDPAIGHFSDNTHTRWGRRRPFLFITTIAGSLLLMGVWWMPRDLHPYLQFTFLATMTTFLFIMWGTYNLNHMALGYELSDDYDNRTKVMAVRTFYFSMAALGGGWLYWLALRPVFGNEITGIRTVAFGLGVITIVTGFTTVFSTKERFKHANRQHVNLWKAIAETFQVKAFVVIVWMRIIGTLGGSLYGAVAFYITTYYVCGNDKSIATSLAGIGGMVGFGVSFIMIPLAAKLSRLIGKRRGIVIGAVAGFASAVTLPFFVLRGHPYILLSHTIFFILINGAVGALSAAVMPDICDLDELQSGKRREGLFSAVNSFINKLEHSICSLLGGYIVAYAGFDPDKAKHLLPQAEGVLDKMRWLGFTPLIFFSGIVLILAFYFPITKAIMDQVRAQLDARRGQVI